MDTEEQYMRRCIELGKQSMQLGNAPVGSVIVHHGEIVGEGLELGKTHNDITFHAEIEAIRDTLKKQGLSKLQGMQLYTTHEPCLMCSYAIRHYEISHVHYGMSTGEIGGHSSDHKLLDTSDISIWSSPPKIIRGLLEAECISLHQEYLDLKKTLS